MPLKFDSATLITELNACASTQLSEIGVAHHGETGGAVYVRWPDGHKSVVTQSHAPVADLHRTADVLALARSRGLPLPQYELIVELSDGIAIVQECMPGITISRPDVPQMDAMVAMNERFAGILADRNDVPVPELRLQDPDWHVPLQEHSERSRAVLAAIRALGNAEMVGHDLVHLDFTPENMLFDRAGNITGIVDWDGSALRGDQRFALIKLRFELAWGALYPPVPDLAVVERLDQHLDALIPPDTLRSYWAHWSLRLLGWTIRNFPEADIDLHIDLARSRLG